MAYKLGLISDEDDQIDEDHTQYANFQYSQQQASNKHLITKTQPSESPPAYDSARADGQWSKNIKDKIEPTKTIRTKQKFAKH
jgi:hypothetical protein